MTDDVPGLYGIRHSNKEPSELWSRDMFPVSFSVALINWMWDKDLPLNYITADDRLRCHVSESWPDIVYGCDKRILQDSEFCFGSAYEPYEEMATGVPPMDLVVRDGRKMPLGRIVVRNSVVPDAITRDLEDEGMGPEISVRTPLLKQCALSVASSVAPRSEQALKILDRGVPSDLDWSDWEVVGGFLEDIRGNIDDMESHFMDMQSPLFVHTIWKSERDGPFMDGDAMDAFVWSDFAFTRTFLDEGGKRSGRVGRLQRCTVRFYLMLTSILRGELPDLDRIVEETGYGLPSEKEFMMNGRQVNRYMTCDRLTRPAVSSEDVTFLASCGFESMIMPERRLDMAVYNAVRTFRG